MAKTSLTVRMSIHGVRETLQALRALPKEANDQIRDKSLELSKMLTGRLQSAARIDSAQSALMAPTIRPARDRVPTVQAGGMRKVGRNRVPAYKVLFGSEFGSNNLKQYRPHQQGGYWFFVTVDNEQGPIAKAWREAADEVVRSFSSGVGG